MKISVILCAYNAQEFLQKSVESILAQSFKDFELILVDAGSSDATPDIIKSYAVRDSRIKSIRLARLVERKEDITDRRQGTADKAQVAIDRRRGVDRRQDALALGRAIREGCAATAVGAVPHPLYNGPSIGRNTGIEEATGDYVCFVDADDHLEPDMLEKLYLAAAENGSQVVCCGYYMDSGNFTRKFLYENFHATTAEEFFRHLPDLLARQLLNVVWNKLYSREFLLSSGVSFPEHMHNGEDRYFNLLVFDQTASFTFVNDPLYHYIVNPGGITYGTFHPDRYLWASQVFNLQLSMFERHQILTPENKAMLSFLYVKVILASCTQLYFNACNWTKSQKKAYITGIAGSPLLADALSAAKATKIFQKFILICLKTRSPLVYLALARTTAFFGTYLPPLLLRMKY